MHGSSSTPHSDIVDVLIIGAGISGIGMAAHLRQRCPQRSFMILEQRARLGGTWDLFRYPGIRSDSDMYTLGYAFAPWRDEKAIAGGDTILAYLERVVAEYGIEPHMRYRQKAIAAEWDSAQGLWTVTSEDGGARQARFLFLGSGYYDYDQPYQPEIPGLESFAGAVIHPQFWPEGFDTKAKRVVVIGSGATAVTLVPALAEAGAKVTMLQRTPSWYLTRPSRDRLARLVRRVLPERVAYALTRTRNVAMQSFFFKRARSKPEAVADFLTSQLRDQLGDAFAPEHFTPPYKPWEQRLCLVPDGDFFDAIKSGKAEVVTGTIRSVEPDGIALDDGGKLPADVIVTATGLKLAVLGKIAVSVDGAAVNFGERFYYRNCMFANVPNFAAIFGYLNASWTLRVDIVAAWLCRLFNQMDAWGVDVVTPVLEPDHALVEDPVFELFSSGYLARDRHLIPRSATTAPWRISMDYQADKRELRETPIDDGVLRFERAGVRPLAPAT
jgi:monooxygenase